MKYKYIGVDPLTPAIGALISGVDISTEITREIVEEIESAFHNHLVLFFEDQKLTPSQLVDFAKRFGNIGYYPFVQGMQEQPEVVEVVKNEDEKINFGGLWHTDTSYLPKPPASSMLYALEVPTFGGDTLFANMYLAYESLSEEFKQLISNLSAVNSAEKPDAAVTRVHRIAEKPRDSEDIITTATHPIVRTHPKTGRKALYCSAAHSLHLEGMSIEESSCILDYLYTVQQKEEFSCRYKWKKGSLAFWDNRCAQHNALNDYHGFRRVMHRVTHEGDVPR